VKGRILAASAAASLVAAGTAWAAFTQEGAPYPTGAAPYTAYAADFNRDGRLDMATNNGDAATLSVFVRQAGGGFVKEGGADVPSASSNGAVGDFNGDGYPDFASAGFVGEGVGILIRSPAGGFTRETSPPLGGRLSAIGIGDFNGDGHGDLAVAGYDAANVTTLVRNASNDGFTTAGSIATGANPRQIAVADYDGDGRLDLAVTNSGSASVTILRGNGDGTFAQEGAPITVGVSPNGIVAGDFNRDGRPDLALTNTGDGTVTVLLRDAANTGFTAGMGSPLAVGASPQQIGTTDFDRNGTLDLAAASGSGLDVLLNTGAGVARDTPTAVEGTPYGVAVGDFNGDTVPDAAVSSLTTNSVTALLSPSPPAQPTPTPTATPTPTPELPLPPAGKVNLIPVSGTVKVKLKGSKKYVTLTEGLQIRVGASVDTRKGRVSIDGPKASDDADFYDGIFLISQSKGLTTLTLTEALDCRTKARTSAKKPKTRKLWGEGKGRFRTKGSYSAATVRGTKWLVTDTCTSTTTRVTQGVVSVEDFVKHKKVTVRAKKHYTARKKKR
jgi:hypothetical protein